MDEDSGGTGSVQLKPFWRSSNRLSQPRVRRRSAHGLTVETRKGGNGDRQTQSVTVTLEWRRGTPRTITFPILRPSGAPPRGTNGPTVDTCLCHAKRASHQHQKPGRYCNPSTTSRTLPQVDLLALHTTFWDLVTRYTCGPIARNQVVVPSAAHPRLVNLQLGRPCYYDSCYTATAPLLCARRTMKPPR